MFGMGKVWGYLAMLAAGAGAVVMLLLTGKKAGATGEKAKQQKKVIENVEKSEKVRRDRRADPGKRDRVSKFDRPGK